MKSFLAFIFIISLTSLVFLLNSCFFHKNSYLNYNGSIYKYDLTKQVDSTIEYKIFSGKYDSKKCLYKLYKNGILKIYTDKNKLLIDGEVINAENKYNRTGTWVYYDKIGKLAIKGYFLDNSKINQWTYFYPSGRESKKEFYDKTNYDTLVNDTLQIYFSQHSAKNGKYYEYYKTGKPKIEGEYKIQPGYSFCYILNHRNKDVKPTYVLGKISLKNGTWTTYKENGKIKKQQVIITGGLHYDNEK